jgi:hypothetical protein
MKLSGALAVAVIGVAASLAPSAHAGELAMSSFQNFSYQLHDLTPDDGIDPWIHFSDLGNYAAQTIAIQGCCFVPVWKKESSGFGSQGAFSWQAGANRAHSVVNGMQVGAATDGSSAGIYMDANAYSGVQFNLGWNTRVVFEVDWTGVVSSSANGYGFSHGIVTLGNYLSGTYDTQDMFLSTASDVSKTFVAELSNHTDLMSGSFSVMAFATSAVFGPFVPQPDADVPEPSTIGLMLAGLTSLGALRRRRQ